MRVFVLDKNKKPLNPTHPARARKLLKSGRAKMFKRFPFIIILQDVEGGEINDCQLEIDPGSKTTGIAIVQGDRVIWGAENTPLEVEHIKPKSKGGSNRVSNLTLACHSCNQTKGSQEIEQFLTGKPNILKRILGQAKKPLSDSAAVNSTRWKLYEELKRSGQTPRRRKTQGNADQETGLPVEVGTGGLTKFNRTRQNLSKTHWLDAACVGRSTPEQLIVEVKKPLLIAAKGHGTRQMCRTDKYGFPTRYVPRQKQVKGFQTGDIVKAIVTKGKKIGTYSGRVAVRSTGSFNILTKTGLIQGISHKYCSPIHQKDGYAYTY